jgi:flagellar biosynthesis/type III secretory pathway M-ring protein FliF/YscJ
VAGVTGFNQERGDQLVIETLPFESTLLLEPPPQPGAPGPAKPAPVGFAMQFDRKTLMVGGGAALGAIVVVFLFAKLLRRKRAAAVEVATEAALPGGESPAGRAALAAATAAQQDLESQLAEREALQQKVDAQALTSLKLAPVITKKAEVLAKHLREKISKEPEVSAQILRTWIREEES